MNVANILNLLNFNEKERKISTEKFYATLSMIPVEDILKNILKELSKNEIYISKAKDLKVLTLSVQDINHKIGMLMEIGEINLVKKNPGILSKNVIAIHRRIKYCKLNSIPYVDEKGNYKEFVLNENEFKKLTNDEKNSNINISEPIESLENNYHSSSEKITPEEIISSLDFDNQQIGTVSEQDIDPISLIDESSFEPENLSNVVPMQDFNPNKYHNISNTNSVKENNNSTPITYDEIAEQVASLRKIRESSQEDLINADTVSFMNFDNFDNGMGRAA